MKQFGRQLKLIIGNQDEAFEVTNLRVTFDVKKALSSEPNPAIIRVYNLNASHRNLLTSKVFNRVSLSVGYDELRLIYAGDIIEAKITESAEDLICELACGDGFTAYTSSLVNKTLAAGNSDTDILNENAQAMGIDIGITELPNDKGNHSVQGNSESSGGTLKHNGKNIGDTHTHSGVQTGAGSTGGPN